MRRRNARKGFWWWSWLLVLCLLLGVLAGWQIGRQKWAALPKEFTATAEIHVTPRPILRLAPSTAGGEQPAALTTGELDLRLLAGMRDSEALGRIAERLQLPEKWKVDQTEAANILRTKIDASSTYEENHFRIKATMSNAEDAALIANTAAQVGMERAEDMMDEDRDTGLRILEGSVGEAEIEVEDARMVLNATLKRNEVPLELPPHYPLSLQPSNPFPSLVPYYELPGVLDAAMQWDRLRRLVSEVQDEQQKLRNYWQTAIIPPQITESAVAPSMASGPDPGPYVQRGVLLGLTIGLATGLLAMFLCWKVFK